MKNVKTQTPIYNPIKSSLSRPEENFPCILIGSGETNSSLNLFLLGNSTATKYLSVEYPKNINQISNSTIYHYDDSFLIKAFQCLDTLYKLPSNWDGYNAEKPNIKAIEQTRLFFKNFFEEVVPFLPNALLNPNITANSEGDIVLEWWFHDKKLTLYISPEQISYIKVAGARIEDMEDGILLTSQDNQQLFNLFVWLIG